MTPMFLWILRTAKLFLLKNRKTASVPPTFLGEVDKIVAVVPCDITDKVRPLGEIDEDAKHMGANLVNFLKTKLKKAVCRKTCCRCNPA